MRPVTSPMFTIRAVYVWAVKLIICFSAPKHLMYDSWTPWFLYMWHTDGFIHRGKPVYWECMTVWQSVDAARAELLRIINKGLMTWPLATRWVNHAWKSPSKGGTSSAQLRIVPLPSLTFRVHLQLTSIRHPPPTPPGHPLYQSWGYKHLYTGWSLNAQRTVRVCQPEFSRMLKLLWSQHNTATVCYVMFTTWRSVLISQP